MTQYFAIVCLGRVGSTYLEQMLDSHPEASCEGEILRPDRIPNASAETVRSTLDRLVHERGGCAAGFKLPLVSFAPPPGIFEVLSDRGYKLVHLYRENRLDQYISLQLAIASAAWRSTDGPYVKDAVELPPDATLANVAAFENADAKIEDMTKAFPRIALSYEQLTGSEGMAAVCEFLGLPPAVMSATISRQRQRSQRESIANYEEVANALRAAGKGHFLQA